MKKKEVMLRIIRFIHKLYPALIPLIVISELVNAATPFVNIIFGSVFIDALVSGSSYREIYICVVWMVLLNAVLVLFCQGLKKLINIRKYNLPTLIWREIASHALKMDYELLEKKETMETIERAVEGMQSYGGPNVFCNSLEILTRCAIDIIYSFLLLVPLFIPSETRSDNVLFGLVNSPAGLVVILVGLVFQLFVLYRCNRRYKDLQQANFENNIEANTKVGALNTPIYEYAQGKDIRMSQLEIPYVEEYSKNTKQAFNNLFSLHRKGEKFTSFSTFASAVFSIICYLYVGIKALSGAVTVGNVAKYVSAFTKFGVALGDLIDIWIYIQISGEYLSHFVDFMEIENHKYDGTLPIEKRDDGEYEFEFKDVSFSYPNSEKPVLDHVSFKLKLKEKMALVGPNGAGKTTFIKLLSRLYDPTEGEILLNGIDIRLYDYDEYIQLFSVVFQDFSIFSFSIAENVAASREFDEEKVRDCLTKAGFGKRLAELDKDIHTNLYQLEDDGVEISGGEAQKIAIARALYKEAPFVIMDEPTSALDPKAEYEIYRSFNELVKKKTAIYISHRMSSCRFCQEILVFDQGRIVEQGSHEELVADTGGLYHEMWNAQAKYYQ